MQENACCPTLPGSTFFFGFYFTLIYAFEAFPGVSSQLSGSWLKCAAEAKINVWLEKLEKVRWRRVRKERMGRLTCSLGTGEVIYDSWRDGTCCQVCVNFLLLLFFKL